MANKELTMWQMTNKENAKNKMVNMLLDHAFYTENVGRLLEQKEWNEEQIRFNQQKKREVELEIIEFVQKLAIGERA